MSGDPMKELPLVDSRVLRLECLRLALARAGAADPRPWREIADDFFAWTSAAVPPRRRGRD